MTLSRDEQARLRGLPGPQNHAYSPLGMIAAAVAWRDCDDWLASLVRRLADQRDLLATLLPEHLPKARMRPLEATYLAWLDLRAYGVDDPAGDALAHGVKVAPGGDYQPGPGRARAAQRRDHPRADHARGAAAGRRGRLSGATP